MRTREWWMAVVGMMLALCMMTSVSAATTTYTDPQGHFLFTVPDGYRPQSVSTPVVAQYQSPTFESANVDIAVGTVLTDTTLLSQTPTRAQFEAALKTVVQGPVTFDFLPGGFGAATVAGRPAIQYDYTVTINKVRYRGRQYAILDGTTVYVFSYAAKVDDFEGFLRESRSVLDTFTILRGSASTFIHRLGDG